MKKLLILLLFVSQNLVSQSTDELFEKGNNQYKLEQYTKAIVSYQKIVESGFISSELFYNKGSWGRLEFNEANRGTWEFWRNLQPNRLCKFYRKKGDIYTPIERRLIYGRTER